MRWKFVIPALTLFALIAVFNLFFLDAILQKAVIAGGQKIFGAKVELATLQTKLSNLSIRLSGLSVADKDAPMKNLFEVENIRFGLNPLPLLHKKVIIEEMTVDGVKWGTGRISSGALPPRKSVKIAKEREKEDKNSVTARLLRTLSEKAKGEVMALPGIEAIRNAEKELSNLSVSNLVNVSGLTSLKAIESMKTELEQKSAAYEQKLQNLKIEEKIERAVAAGNAVADIKVESVQDISAAQQSISALNDSKKELEQGLNDLKEMQNQLESELGDQRELLARINELKNNDFDSIASKLKLPSFDFGNVSSYIFGPVWISRVSNAVYYFHVARKYMPARKKEEQRIARQRAKGIDVHFPVQNRPPDLLIKKIVISGTSGGPGKEGPAIDFKGTITGITSDPVLLGIPMKLTIQGAREGQALALNGIFDHTKEASEDSLSIEMSGIKAKDVNLPSSDYLPSFENSRVKLDSRFVLKDGGLNCDLALVLSGIEALPAEKTQADEIKMAIATLWAGIPSIDINARLGGTPEKLEMALESNVDKLLSERMKNIFGGRIAEIQNNIKAEIDRLTREKQNELLSKYASVISEAQKQLAAREKEVQGKIDSAKAVISQKESEIREEGEKEKKKAEEEIQKKATEKLKDLFKF